MPSLSKPLRLDTWELMDGEFLDPQRSQFERSFRIKDGAMVFCDANRKSSRTGKLVLMMNWSNRKGPSGFVAVSHPDWETLPRFVLLTGIPNKGGGLQWRFLCPISRKLVQVVYFDKESHLFVARGALGRPQRKSDFRRIGRYLGQMLELQEKQQNTPKKPRGMSERSFDLLKGAVDDATEDVTINFMLAASGVTDPIVNPDGWFDVVAMSKQPVPQAHLKNTIYRRDKAGILRLNARSKKRLGIS